MSYFSYWYREKNRFFLLVMKAVSVQFLFFKKEKVLYLDWFLSLFNNFVFLYFLDDILCTWCREGMILQFFSRIQFLSITWCWWMLNINESLLSSDVLKVEMIERLSKLSESEDHIWITSSFSCLICYNVWHHFLFLQ